MATAGLDCQAILESVEDGVYVLDSERRKFTYVNEGAARQTGYSREELLRRSTDELAEAHDLVIARELVRSSLTTTGSSVRFESRQRRRDGSLYAVDVRMTLLSAPGAPRRMLAIVRESTELRALRAMVDGLVDCVVTIDPSGTVRSANAAVERTFGYAPQEIVGRNVSMLMTGVERANHDEYLARYLREGKPRIIGIGREVPGITRDGKPLVLELTVNEFVVAGDRFFTGVLRDVTERRNAENALRASEQRWKFALEGAGDGIWDWDLAADRYLVSNRWREILGYDDNHPFDHPSDWEALVHPDDLLAVMRDRRLHLDGVLPLYAHEYRMRCRLGAYRWVLDRGMVVERDSDGAPLRMLGTHADVTERHRVLEELERAKTDAETATRAKSAFLATMSHEIRTPMNGVIGMLDVLSRQDLSADIAEVVETARVSATSLLRIIDDVLDFSKIEADRLRVSREPTSIADVVFGVAETIQPLAASNGVCLRAVCDPRMPQTLDTDVVRVRQILNNLVGNAVKFSSRLDDRRGEVTLRADAEVDADGRVDAFCFSVIDNGIGLSAEDLPRLFRAFEQGEGSTTRRYGGTGLGLSITKRLVELLGGEIEVTSELGNGTVFRVRFPIAPIAASPPSFSLEGLVCVVDAEEPRLRDDLVRILAHAGTSQILGSENHIARSLVKGDASTPVVWLRSSGASAEEETPVGIPSVILRPSTSRRAALLRPGLATVDGEILRPEMIIDAVALALGWTIPSRMKVSREFPSPPSKNDHGPLPDAAAWGAVLVAEDNPINQKVIVRQLAMLGLEAEVAGDGREALNRWRSFRHRMVLTDLHMPLMDGYELARSIRREESTPGHTRIIAISAHVHGDADHGDPDFDLRLSKPLQMNAFESALRELAADRSDQPVSMQFAPFALETLVELVGDDEVLLGELLSDFLVDAGATVGQIERAHADGGTHEVGRLAHRLKSSAYTVGAKDIGDVCTYLEQCVRANDDTAVQGLVRRLSRTWDHSERSIRQTLRKLGRDDG